VESLNVDSTHRVTVESLGVNVESNWTHVPHGYKDEPEMIKKLMDRIAKHEADVKEATQAQKHAGDHARIENLALQNNIKKQRYLLEDFKDLVDMFATGNVDLAFYKKVMKDYLNSI
jgi:hypothetical protein